MKRALLIAGASLLATPAQAAIWITVLTAPLGADSTRMVGYQIDVASKRVIGGDVYAQGRWSHWDPTDAETLRAQCSKKRLMVGADQMDPYWVEKVGQNWVFDTLANGGGSPYFSYHGSVQSSPSQLRESWLQNNKIFEALCE